MANIAVIQGLATWNKNAHGVHFLDIWTEFAEFLQIEHAKVITILKKTMHIIVVRWKDMQQNMNIFVDPKPTKQRSGSTF